MQFKTLQRKAERVITLACPFYRQCQCATYRLADTQMDTKVAGRVSTLILTLLSPIIQKERSQCWCMGKG